MSSAYRDHLNRLLRGALLRALSEAPTEQGSDVLLHMWLANTPYRCGLANVTEQLRWLAGRGYVRLEAVGDMSFATITQRGIDVASGAEGDPDVQRERPR